MPTKGSTPLTTPAEAVRSFVRERLQMARERMGLTRKELAARISSGDGTLTPGAITHFEKGRHRPSETNLVQLSWALRVDLEYFTRPVSSERLEFEDCQFRAHANVSQKHRKQVVQSTEEVRELVLAAIDVCGLDDLPEDRIAAVRETVLSRSLSPEEAADYARSAWAAVFQSQWHAGWRLTDPMRGVLRLIEHLGALIVPIPKAVQSQQVDAFSAWVGNRAIIALSQHLKSPSRITYDALHELGHLLMHDATSDDLPPGSRQLELEANQFAGAFLSPKASFAAECPTRWDLGAFLSLKEKWQVSVAALAMRARQVGRLSSLEVQKAFRELNRLGLRFNEPAEWQLQEPVVVWQIVSELLKSEHRTPEIVAFVGEFDWQYETIQGSVRPKPSYA